MSIESQRWAEQEAMKTLNRIWGEMFGGRTQHDYLYYAPGKPANASRTKDQYFYTVAKKLYNGKLRYVSGIYRYNASAKQWKAIKKAGHAKKKDAIERARKLSKQNA